MSHGALHAIADQSSILSLDAGQNHSMPIPVTLSTGQCDAHLARDVAKFIVNVPTAGGCMHGIRLTLRQGVLGARLGGLAPLSRVAAVGQELTDGSCALVGAVLGRALH